MSCSLVLNHYYSNYPSRCIFMFATVARAFSTLSLGFPITRPHAHMYWTTFGSSCLLSCRRFVSYHGSTVVHTLVTFLILYLTYSWAHRTLSSSLQCSNQAAYSMYTHHHPHSSVFATRALSVAFAYWMRQDGVATRESGFGRG